MIARICSLFVCFVIICVHRIESNCPLLTSVQPGHNFLQYCSGFDDTWVAELKFNTQHGFDIGRVIYNWTTGIWLLSPEFNHSILAFPETEGFQQYEHYVACFRRHDAVDCAYPCTIIRICDCDCEQYNWLNLTFQPMHPQPGNFVEFKLLVGFSDGIPLNMTLHMSVWANYKECHESVDTWLDQWLDETYEHPDTACWPVQADRVHYRATSIASVSQAQSRYALKHTRGWGENWEAIHVVAGIELKLEDIKERLEEEFEHVVHLPNYYAARTPVMILKDNMAFKSTHASVDYPTSFEYKYPTKEVGSVSLPPEMCHKISEAKIGEGGHQWRAALLGKAAELYINSCLVACMLVLQIWSC